MNHSQLNKPKLSLKLETNCNLGIDIGGTYTKFAVVKDRQVIYRFKIKTSFEAKELWINDVLTNARTIRTKYHYAKIAISSTGQITSDGKVVGTNLETQNYLGTNWKKIINDFFKEEIFLYSYNDAHAFANYIKNHYSNNTICLTIGTGVGLSIINNQQIFQGPNFQAGQIGSLIWQNNQTIDQYFSATNLAQKISKIINQPFIFQNLKKYYDQNWQVKKLLDNYLEQLSKLLVFITAITDPELVIISGGISYSSDFLLVKIRKLFNFQKPQQLKFSPQIKYAKAKNDTNILGLFTI